MTQRTIHEAKKHLSYNLCKALDEEKIVIANGQRTIAELVVPPEAQSARRIGSGKGVIQHLSDNFDAPLEDFQDYMQ